MSIPKIRDIEENNKLISSKFSELKDKDDIESRPFLISYQKYNDRLCEIDNLIKNCPKSVLFILKKIGNNIYNFKEFENNGINRFPIKKNGDYKKLFRGLHEDVDLYEHKISGTARIFYFISEVRKIFYVVAITQKHFEINKNKK